MRLVVDTNVLVSAFLWQGTPGRLIELAAETEIELFTSRALIDELSEVLHKGIPIVTPAQAIQRIAAD